MRLFELICAASLFVVFSACALSSIKPGLELYEKTVELEKIVDRDSFLAKGFISLCKENDGEKWYLAADKWKEMCLAMWPLEKLECECTDGFYAQTWEKDGFSMRVECPVEKGNEK